MSKLKPGYTCFHRPNRSYKRTYTANDVARIYCLAIQQGELRTDINAAIAKKCPITEPECTCEKMIQNLLTAQSVAAMTLEMIAMLVPILKVLKKIRTILNALKKAKIMPKQLEQMDKDIPRLEDLDDLQNKVGSAKPVIEGEYARVVREYEELTGAQVVIKP